MEKNLPVNAEDARDVGSISGSGRSLGVGNGNPLHDACLENSMDRGACSLYPWVTESDKTEHSFTHYVSSSEKILRAQPLESNRTEYKCCFATF